ncbi:MAG: histidine phosphatase family protein [Alphaproteobacteria bacterium]|nr:MAG: histidine phosphatase family protein [Alphaproteobacteria bacterium]
MRPELLKKPFLFLRHGETPWNAENRLIGQEDIPLSFAGIAQAYKAARLLKDIPIDCVVHSPLGRCTKTAMIVNAHLRAHTRVEDGLREAHLGEFQGCIKDEQKSYNVWLTNPPSDAETFPDFQKRVMRTLQNILLDDHDKATLIVSHGGVFDALQKYLGLPKFYLPLATPVLIYPCHVANRWKLCVMSDPFIQTLDMPTLVSRKNAKILSLVICNSAQKSHC